MPGNKPETKKSLDMERSKYLRIFEHLDSVLPKALESPRYVGHHFCFCFS